MSKRKKTRSILPGAYVHLPDGPGRLRWLPVTPVCYWDELNKSPWPILHAALRLANARCATVVAGTHEDRSALPRRLGIAVEAVEFSTITAQAVLRWAERRIQADRLEAAAPDSPAPVITFEVAERVAARAGTNWRSEAFAFSIEPVVMVFNPVLLEARLRPTSRYRLVERLRSEPQRFHGKVGTYDPARSGTGYFYLTQDMEQSPIVWELISALGQSDARLFATSRGIIDAVASGRLLVGYIVVGSCALARAASEPSLEVVMPEDYTLVVARTAIISRYGRRPDLARRFLDFLLSREGQRVVSGASGLFPIRADAEGESMAALSRRTFGGVRSVRMSPGPLVYLDRLNRQRVLNRWQDAIQAGVPPR